MKSTIHNPQSTIPNLIPSLTTGLVLGVLEVATTISFAALIFTGSLSSFTPFAIGYALMGTIICGVIIALFTSLPGVVSGTQDVPAAIMAVMSAAIVGLMPAEAAAGETFLTVVAAIALTTAFCGLFFVGTGYFRLGNLARFLPYPVIGGFLAGTGWLLIAGAVGLMVDVPAEPAQWPTLFQPEVILRWLPGVLLAILMMIAIKRVDHYLVMPVLLLLSLVLFFLVAWMMGYSVADLSANGWLLGPFAGEKLWQPLTPADLAGVYWPAVARQAGGIATAAFVSTVSLLLNASGVELAVYKDIDLDRELRVSGVANMVAGLAAGLVSFHVMSFCVLNFRLKANTRLTGLTIVAVCVLALVAGASLLAIFPKAIIGALLLLTGLAFIDEWVIEGWSRLPRIDYAIVISILLVTAFVGFFEAVALGLLLAIILFVVGYSRVDVVRHELSAATYRSRVVRSPDEEELLIEQGDKIYILQLQGFIFFGTADSLLEQVLRRVNDGQMPRLTAVVLDFEYVSGLDTTAMISFGKLKNLAEKKDFTLVLCAANNRVCSQLQQGGLSEEYGLIRYFNSVDQGTAWCEKQLLAHSGMHFHPAAGEAAGDPEEILLWQLMKNLAADGGPQAPDVPVLDAAQQEAIVKVMISYFRRIDIDAGTVFITQGRPANSLYFLAAGTVTTRLKMPDGDFVRLETLSGCGRVVGEIGFFLGRTRTADVLAESPGILFRLTQEDLARMKKENPAAASMLYRLTANILAERVTRLTRSISALER